MRSGRACCRRSSARAASPSSRRSRRLARRLVSTRVIAMTQEFRRARVRERVLLVLPVGRSPPRGAILEATVRVAEPRPAARRLRRARLARAPGHPRGARSVELASDRPPRGNRRPRRPAARPGRACGRAWHERRSPRHRPGRRPRRGRGAAVRRAGRLPRLGALPPARRLRAERRLPRGRRLRPRLAAAPATGRARAR